MHRRNGSEYKNRRSRWPPPSPNLRTSPTEEHHLQSHTAGDLMFPISLPRSTSNTWQAADPTRTNARHNNRPSSTDSQSALFSGGSTSGTQSSVTSAGSEGFAPFQPQHHPILPQQPLQSRPVVHVNPQTGRVLTAADFARSHSPSPPPSSSDSSGQSRQSSVGSFTCLPPQFPPPTSSTQPIPIPQASFHPNYPFTPQHNVPQPHHRRPRNNKNPPLPGPSNWPHPGLSNGG